MPPIINSCTPQCKFWFPRSYLKGVQVSDYEANISWDVNVATVTLTIPVTYYHVFVFNPILWDWNSNTYSLDYILEDMYYFVPPDPTHIQTPVDIAWVNGPPPIGSYIRVAIPAAPLNLPIHLLPPGPSNWWSG